MYCGERPFEKDLLVSVNEDATLLAKNRISLIGCTWGTSGDRYGLRWSGRHYCRLPATWPQGLKAVRLIRPARNVRILRYMSFAREFHKMILTIYNCLITLFWSFVLVFCVTVTFAICLTLVTTAARIEETSGANVKQSSNIEELHTMFGSVSLFTFGTTVQCAEVHIFLRDGQ